MKSPVDGRSNCTCLMGLEPILKSPRTFEGMWMRGSKLAFPSPPTPLPPTPLSRVGEGDRLPLRHAINAAPNPSRKRSGEREYFLRGLRLHANIQVRNIKA